MFCQNCGKEYDGRVCPNCGNNPTQPQVVVNIANQGGVCCTKCGSTNHQLHNDVKRTSRIL